MKFKPILGSDLSGHIGGVVASHNTYGPYFRQRVRPVNKRTPAMQAQRAAIAQVSQIWRSLDPSVQSAWTAATVTKTSRKGDRVALTGSAAWMYVNVLRQRIGLPLIYSPPSDPTPSPFTAETFAMSGYNTFAISFAADPWNSTGGGIIMSAALLTSNGKSFASPSNAVKTLLGPQTNPVSVTLPFAVPIGARVRVQFHATGPDGRQSTYVSADAENPSYPPPVPAGVGVISVTAVSSTQAVWHLDQPIIGAANPAYLLINGNPAAGPVATLPGNDVLATYTGPITVGQAWTVSDAAATTPPARMPQSGFVV
jgi:hypothetical protein